MAKIGVLGAGGFGIALSVMCNKMGHEVTLWSAFPAEITEIIRDGQNLRLLPKVKIPQEIKLTSNIEDLQGNDLIILAVPSFAVRETAHKLQPYMGEGSVLATVAKGLEDQSHKRLSEVIAEELPQCKIVVISGPSHAEEVATGVPTTVVAASSSRQAAEHVQDLLMNPTLRIYVNDDIKGVEYGGALKNVIALAAGICDGQKLGDNSKAALMTRGITEIARLGVALGANHETFGGLSGIGDLIVTCTSMHSRNRRAGIFIGQGNTARQALEKVGMTVEGYLATKAAYELSKSVDVEMPIVEQCYLVLYKNKSPKKAIADLMGRPKRHESETIWLQTK
ncbi:glycerol 3-phosphate dehydrogenase (NAD(P)+) [Hydrogenoanaerobacterium saccharovorans]|uniref:Glycerol-3-phosphate dehydrogenase [NAD(P)+] n=1 Tax=Hydrogenoanaerobacterium saccharovorans TaxID=474960 RepID=A0A1H8D385_9FIRM|nr:NAD(P)H-dependent glycerol-3-phosphate dehydrogenase [Hydrogenoanaerobacterium saccharovorans]RPF43460.1 glycerol 3-phosphate dehydrogenase (NAD(P)+) [Hydrogenoanaerobacterium saccharovorans]SEN01629.1 glycerol 3-phosphate dehydrogenase (NAD(P)+) [Hydrogenoanaerobacterium saccharovorans]